MKVKESCSWRVVNASQVVGPADVAATGTALPVVPGTDVVTMRTLDMARLSLIIA